MSNAFTVFMEKHVRRRGRRRLRSRRIGRKLAECISTGTKNENAMNKLSATDWARIDALSDEAIDTSGIPPLPDAFFARARLKMPRPPKVEVAIRVDSDVLDWFKAQGEDWEQRANAALGIYAEAHLVCGVSDHAA